jgi:hypothetical protein
MLKELNCHKYCFANIVNGNFVDLMSISKKLSIFKYIIFNNSN